MSTSPRAREVGRIFQWAAIALLGIYLVTVVAAALPLNVRDPAWIERVAGSLRGGVSFPLIGLALLFGGAYLRDPDQHETYLPALSFLSYLAALAFFLLIPLQTWAAVKVLNRVADQESEQLKVFSRGLERIRLSLTQEQLSDAIASIPGAPRFTPGTLTVPLAEARQSLIRQIEPQLRQRATQLEAADSQRWQQALLRLFKDAVVSLFAALGFAAAGRRRRNYTTLLENLRSPRRSSRFIDPHVRAMADAAEDEERQARTYTNDL